MAAKGRIRALMATVWLAQQGALGPWVPVFLGTGIGSYFALRAEPGPAAYAGLCMVAVSAAALAIRGRMRGALWPPFAWAVALIAAGGALAGGRAHMVAGPVLAGYYYGPVEGRIIAIDRSASDVLRLTLDRVVLADMAPDRTPVRVRVSLHGDDPGIAPRPGLRVILTGHLSPPNGPAEPGGFDFRRHAWFQRLGGVGYTRLPVLGLAPPDGATPLFAARMALSAQVRAQVPGEVGAVAAAIMTGDRSGLRADTVDALRRANLAHLLAISGLHMGLVAGFVFALVRLILAAIPPISLRWPCKKIAAGAALLAACGYLGLSGGNVATQRAFIMAAVMLSAVLLDRRAFSLRAVALAATIVLVLRPEALLGPGFQMSFAATVALVSAFNGVRGLGGLPGPRWLRAIAATVLSSAVAGAATAPFAAAHFNQFASYGLAANLASVPLMGIVVMPAAVLAAGLIPLGLATPALWVMALGLRWIMGVAHWIASLDGARRMIPSPAPDVLPLLAMGALFLVLWQGRSRVLGAGPILVALLVWATTPRPDLLISEDGGLAGVMTPQGRALSRARGSGFVAGLWMENDGDPATQDRAARRWPEAGPDTPVPLRTLRGKRGLAQLDHCLETEWVVLNVDPPPDLLKRLPCRIIAPATLRRTGALAVFATPQGPRIVSANQVTGTRLWAPGPAPQ